VVAGRQGHRFDLVALWKDARMVERPLEVRQGALSNLAEYMTLPNAHVSRTAQSWQYTCTTTAYPM
jgi:hypothetical protein